MFRALVSACGVWDQVGRKKIETYDLTLSAYLKERIAETWGVDRLYSPKDDPKLVSAVTSFNPFNNAGDILNSARSNEFVARMLSDYSPGFVIRNVNVPVVGAPGDHYPIRISTHLWTSVDDVERLVLSMDDLRRKMG
jgi:selenocysteine lyase/cysteine desulfurase